MFGGKIVKFILVIFGIHVPFGEGCAVSYMFAAAAPVPAQFAGRISFPAHFCVTVAVVPVPSAAAFRDFKSDPSSGEGVQVSTLAAFW